MFYVIIFFVNIPDLKDLGKTSLKSVIIYSNFGYYT